MMDYRVEARKAAQKYGLRPEIFLRQIQQESGFNPHARSPAGALGIAQIMPATAQGWGVNPLNPRAALNAAAKNMARYVDQFGNYEDALRAYNAGPGNVKASRGFAETNHYVQTILRGAKSSGHTSLSADSNSSDIGTRTRTIPGVDNSAARAAAQATLGANARSFLDDPRSDILDFALQQRGVQQQIQSLQDTPSRTVQVPGSPGMGGGMSAGRGSRPASQLKELFWQGQGGIDVKNGQPEPQGFVSGHTDHVHVATGPKQLNDVARQAQRFGLHVGENPNYGGVHPVHVKGSYHYKGEAIDVSGDPKKMARFARWVAQHYGVRS